MAYFAREEKPRHHSPPKARGKVVGARDVPPPKDMVTRDQVIEQNIDAMQKTNGNRGAGVLRFVSDEKAKGVHQRNPNHKPDSDIFGPPKLEAKPTPRIRTGVTDDELRKIWAEDERKVEAAARMQKGSTMVEKMVAAPVNPVVPSTRKKDAVPPPRKQVNLLTETTEQKNRQAFEPMGFGGMGKQCKHGQREGRSCKEVEEFTPPELKAAPKQGGRRTKFPPDTFSFQDDAQTA